jgi:RNA polymerase sigma-54 factor
VGGIMALLAKLQLRQAQTLVITPQLLQGIRLLQMSSLELERFLATEIEQNPLLEIESSAAEDLGSPGPGGDDPASDGEGGDGAELEPSGGISDLGWANDVSVRSSGTAPSSDLLEQTVAATGSLVEMLEREIDAAFAGSPTDRLIALSLLGTIDEAGYLTARIDDLAAQLGTAPERIERVLARCQAIAPTGLFARSLAECLALQLAERNRLDPAMRALLADLEGLAAGDRAGLCARCGVDREDLEEMIAEIRALDPKPGLAWDHEPQQIRPPDVFVRRAPGGGWRVEPNDETLPRLIVNRTYHAEIAARAGRESEKKFLADCLQKASWLEKSLDQRARTVLTVAGEIVRRQEAFLKEGVSELRPLNLRIVADALGIHESTVSRAAANKTIATPRGVFEFRYFFTVAIPATTGGEAHSAEAVKHRIRRMILDESPDAVLSDDAIVTRLSGEGIEIARRTVAKYRELMRIGSSVDRRREKRLRNAS